MDTKEKIEVMQAYLAGKDIEYKCKGDSVWTTPPTTGLCPKPIWNWENYDYRIKKYGPRINWDHVSEDYNYLAQDIDGRCYLYKSKPFIDENGYWYWSAPAPRGVEQFKSFVEADDYKILTIRPGIE